MVVICGHLPVIVIKLDTQHAMKTPLHEQGGCMATDSRGCDPYEKPITVLLSSSLPKWAG